LIDIHSHILPGLDDGADCLEESLAMLRMAAEAGTTDIVATPHANDQYPYDPKTVRSKIAELREASGESIRVHQGCDFHLSFSNIQDALENPTKYTINGRNYILVEFSDMALPPNALAIFDAMLAAGMVPIITHPERNPVIRKDLRMVSAWVEHDCLIQVTGDSLLGRFGKAAIKAARELMEWDLVHVIASDAHNTRSRTPALREAYAHVAKHYSQEHAEVLFVSNPKAILSGQPVDTVYLKGLRRRSRTWGLAWW
jgi:protein-tyrosine phosphatase